MKDGGHITFSLLLLLFHWRNFFCAHAPPIIRHGGSTELHRKGIKPTTAGLMSCGGCQIDPFTHSVFDVALDLESRREDL